MEDTKQVIDAIVIHRELDINEDITIDGIITDDAKTISEKILAKIEGLTVTLVGQNVTEDPNFEFVKIESDSTDGKWRTIVWNSVEHHQGSDQPIIIVCRQSVEWK